MILNELYELLQEELSHELIGDLFFDGIAIKWEYDSFNKELDYDENELEHLHNIYDDDLELINEYLIDEDYNISDPTIEDTYISFYIEE